MTTKANRKFRTRATFALLFLTTVFISCSKEKGGGKTTVTEDVLTGHITGLKTLDASVTYILDGAVIVEDGAVLNIPAGTVIKAKKGFNNYILVLQGGKINVQGTAEKPVTMTADIADAAPGHWGGLIINGRAPLAGGTIGSTEISSAYQYGGNQPDDHSGTITYLTIAYSGARSNADVEHNGLTLNGVGSGTKIENIYIPFGADDGIEFFGGTVNVKNLLVVDSDDDMFDFTQGYTGTLENAYGLWQQGYRSTESDPRGIEADGNFDGNFPEHSGPSDFVVKNITFDLRLAAAPDQDVQNVTNKMQDVIKVRRGAKVNIVNAVVKGTGTVVDIIDFSDGKGAGNPESKISVTNELSASQVLGKGINPEAGYPAARIEAGNTGCPTAVFAWTKYQF